MTAGMLFIQEFVCQYLEDFRGLIFLNTWDLKLSSKHSFVNGFPPPVIRILLLSNNKIFELQSYSAFVISIDKGLIISLLFQINPAVKSEKLYK
jgi:hypothetical protein